MYMYMYMDAPTWVLLAQGEYANRNRNRYIPINTAISFPKDDGQE